MATVSTDRRRGINSGAAIKVACVCATTANITLSGEQTIDGITTDGMRVMVKNQTDATEIGIYLSSTSAWTREPDFDGTYDVTEGTLVPVSRGTANTASFWRITNTGSITIGTTELTVVSSSLTTGAILDNSDQVILTFGADESSSFVGDVTIMGAQGVTINAATPRFDLVDNDAGTDQGTTRVTNAKMRILDDALANAYTYFDITRSGTGASVQVDTIDITSETDVTITTPSVVVTGTITSDSIVQPIVKIIDIGFWNMDTISSVSVAHGLTLANIRSVTALIREDGGTFSVDLSASFDNTNAQAGILANATHISLARTTGGFFDGSTSYDDPSYNRGWITITYV